MTDIAPLSTGVIERIMRGEEVDKPVLQIVVTKIIKDGEKDRLRLFVSDGKCINSYCMLATQLNQLHVEGKLSEYTIVRVDKYITSAVNDNVARKRVLIIVELSVLKPGNEVGKKIGTPVSYTEEDAAQSNKASSSNNGTVPKPTATSNAKKAEPHPSPYNNNNTTSLNQSLTVGHIHPISSLSPNQNEWIIKARVTTKDPMRTWMDANGIVRSFSVNLIDESGEIRATAFREQAETFFDIIEVDRVYYISKCQLKSAKKQFNTLKHDYEMTLTGLTEIKPCEEDDNDIPEIKYDLVPISELANLEARTSVDTIGICKEIGELQTFPSGKKRRELTLVDSSNAAVILKLWNEDAVNFDGHVQQQVILVKGARVTEFNGDKEINKGNGTVMKINPDIPEGHKLRGWFDNGGGEHISNMISTRIGGAGGGFSTEWLTLHEARSRNLGAGDKPDYFQCKVVVHVVQCQNVFYKGCPQPNCNKKVIDENNGHYRCERCNAVFPNFKYRLLIKMSISDCTSTSKITCFSEVGEQLLNRSAQEIGDLLENNPPEGEEVLSSINFNSYIFKLRSKMEEFNVEQRNKLTVQSVAPMDYKEYNKYFINNLKELTGINKN